MSTDAPPASSPASATGPQQVHRGPAAPRRGPATPAQRRVLTQAVQVRIVGGDLTLVNDHASVELARLPGSGRDWTGVLPPVRLIDARGTHDGWRVRWTVESVEVIGTTRPARVPAARVRLEPGSPTVVQGMTDGLMSGKPGPSVKQGRTLFEAQPGSGGGTYEVGAAVSVRLPPPVDAEAVTVHLAFELVT